MTSPGTVAREAVAAWWNPTRCLLSCLSCSCSPSPSPLSCLLLFLSSFSLPSNSLTSPILHCPSRASVSPPSLFAVSSSHPLVFSRSSTPRVRARCQSRGVNCRVTVQTQTAPQERQRRPQRSAMALRPSLLTRGLSGPASSDTGSPAEQRDDAKKNMLKAMRPLPTQHYWNVYFDR